MKIGNLPTASELLVPQTKTGKALLATGSVLSIHYSRMVTQSAPEMLAVIGALSVLGLFAQRYTTRDQRDGYLLNKPVAVDPDAIHANLELTDWMRGRGLALQNLVTEAKSHQFRILIIPNEDPASVKKIIPSLSMKLGVAEEDLVWRQNFRRGKSAILVPLPRSQWRAVPFTTEHFEQHGIQHFIGTSIDGEPMILDRTLEPHALVSGSTNSGKSELINSMIAADRKNPLSPKIFLIDPKESLDTDADETWTDLDDSTDFLESMVDLMKRRQAYYRERGSKDFITHIAKLDNSPALAFDKPVMIYIDEMADLVTPEVGQSRKKGTTPRHERAASALDELARKCRSAGIYLTIGIQSPKAEILNTKFRNNLGCRIALNVVDATASRVALDQNGAETLPKFGACLFKTSLHRSPILGRAAIVQ